ncbi:cellulase family glycosylhydrolase [Pleomorphovibrio marinus]|uniref:cellulase family glycosylhydrolase n=1 Tax=Pleomorphovibrio marinus TaxID=2164132 RepID=UPI000E0C4493|nr:cellulase family glycosylhydrolase [Pleomorphovibrio marinus]
MRNNVVLFLFILLGCHAKEPSFQTRVSIEDEKWHINGELVNPGSPAEGLLMNVRMVNAVFEDRGEKWRDKVGKFDPEQNTEMFIAKLPEYVNQGVNAFVISLQGGMPGYEGAINSAYEPDGKLRDSYLDRVESVIKVNDKLGAVVILSCFYQRQRGHKYALDSKKSILNAVENTAQWIKEKGYTNVILEVANEFPHGGFKGWPDADWLISDQGQIDLIRTAKKNHPGLLVSTSGLGHGRFPDALIPEVDYILIHFNNTSLADYGDKINALKGHGKPIVCNEDDKVGKEGAAALALAVYHGAAWGFMHSATNQNMPFEFNGIEDDREVYEMFKKVSTQGEYLKIDELEQPSLTITFPNDGNRFKEGETIEVAFTGMFLERLENPQIVFRVNEEVETREVSEPLSWQPPKKGDYFIYLEVFDQGKLVYTSAPVDITVE